MSNILDPANVEQALRRLIATDVDYDIHKEIELNEAGEDDYPELTATFIDYLNNPKAG
jgi:hypothetical protein